IADGKAVEETQAATNRWWPIAAALFAVIAIVAIIMFARERIKPPAPPVVFALLPPHGFTAIGTPTISPDGRVVAFQGRDESGQLTLLMRHLADIESTRLANVDCAF